MLIYTICYIKLSKTQYMDKSLDCNKIFIRYYGVSYHLNSIENYYQK